jgi:glycosyltransferase involved in cell wall biosynthesis
MIAPPWLAVPPVDYGGTELVIDLLARGLQAAGCEVALFTTGDSTCPVPRRWLHPRSLGICGDAEGERAHLEEAYRHASAVDVLHDHTVMGPSLSSIHPPGVPVVTTLHGPMIPEVRDQYAQAAVDGVHLVAISHEQARLARPIPTSAVIHHGIDLAGYPFGGGDGGYVLFLGRMCADKGAHRAITAVRRAGKRIVLAAKMRERDEHRYFTEMVEPLLGEDARYVGEVKGREKRELLAGAEALVNPIRWPEPFGLVMIEALACGTPVLAFPEGAAPEIVDHERTGFLCQDEDDMVARLGDLGGIDRATCRARAESRFSAQRMVEDHLRLYRDLTAAPVRGEARTTTHPLAVRANALDPVA